MARTTQCMWGALSFLVAGTVAAVPLGAQEGRSLDIAYRGWGLSLGDSRGINGLRFNYRDSRLEVVNGLNATIWVHYPGGGGTVNGVALGLPATGGDRIRGVGLGLLGLAVEQDARGIMLAGIGLGSGGSVSGVTVGGVGLGAGGSVRGLTVAGVGVGAGGSLAGISVAGV
ncbi:MAG TPA: hypothetical protein VNL96_05250, partial [Gemmatimonadaceae bacterium]|nr:hypothetical protein [Gemmatimonadaceae bacterium]